MFGMASPFLAAFPYENLVFLAFIVIAAIFRLVGKIAESAKKKPAPPSAPAAPVRPKAVVSETEQVRRFLEALGQPTEAPPPRPVVQRPPPPPTPQPRPRTISPIDPFPRTNVPLPPASEKPVPPPVATEAPPPLPLVPAPAAAAPQIPVTASEIGPQPYALDRERVRQTASKPTAKFDLVALLHSSGAARQQAIVLREILGPPRGLQPMTSELTG